MLPTGAFAYLNTKAKLSDKIILSNSSRSYSSVNHYIFTHTFSPSQHKLYQPEILHTTSPELSVDTKHLKCTQKCTRYFLPGSPPQTPPKYNTSFSVKLPIVVESKRTRDPRVLLRNRKDPPPDDIRCLPQEKHSKKGKNVIIYVKTTPKIQAKISHARHTL